MSTDQPIAAIAAADVRVYYPGVSLIIAARNAAPTLTACLASLRALDYPDTEIIVVDDGSTDDTIAVASGAGVRIIRADGRGPSFARNLGVRECSNEIVAFTDADCVVPRHWLKTLVDALRTSEAGAVGGPQRNVFPAGATDDARDLDAFFALASVIAEYTRGDDTARDVDHNASCNVVYLKHVFDEAGGFAEGLFPGEDVDLDLRVRRLGYRCHYVPGAWVEHHRPGTREWFARMMRRYGRAQREIVERHGRFRALHYVPMALVLAAVAQALLIPRRTRMWMFLADAALGIGALGLLAKKVPPDRWVAVMRYATIALREWMIGYGEGLKRP
ncbi:MAG: glycosyltransferase [Acidobacteria bacterium]|nr:glycosyltransferase [Acidobacteriota bacterium]